MFRFNKGANSDTTLCELINHNCAGRDSYRVYNCPEKCDECRMKCTGTTNRRGQHSGYCIKVRSTDHQRSCSKYFEESCLIS